MRWARVLFLGVMTMSVLSPFAHAKGEADRTRRAVEVLLCSRSAVRLEAYEAAAREVRLAADAGQALAQFTIAVISRNPDAPLAARLSPSVRQAYWEAGRGVVGDLAEGDNDALAWYLLSLADNDEGALRRAAEAGEVHALNALGLLRLQTLERSPLRTNETFAAEAARESLRYFRAAALQRDANGHYNFGICLMSGYGCKVNQQLGFEQLLLAARAGHHEAMDAVALCYERGDAVAKDVSRAVYWRMCAKAARGDEPAQAWVKEEERLQREAKASALPKEGK